MNILIADDDRTSRLVLAATLRKLGHTVTAVENGRQALQAWEEDRYPLLISDWMMPGLDGLALCQLIRSKPSLHYTHIILLTSLDGKGRYLDAMEGGADDFITKPFDEEMLAVRIRVAERILALHETLRRQALRDPLIGLWNRAAIMDRLNEELERAHRSGGQVGVVMADLDRFKQINDEHGHQAGDAVLLEAAKHMQAALRPYDSLGRYGGEEFLIVVPGCTQASVTELAQRVCKCVSAQPMHVDDKTIEVTVSLGVALSAPGVRAEESRLVAAADAALYRAKEAGRNCAAFDASAVQDGVGGP